MGEFIRGDDVGLPFGSLDVLDGARGQVLLEGRCARGVVITAAHEVRGGGVVLFSDAELSARQSREIECSEFDE